MWYEERLPTFMAEDAGGGVAEIGVDELSGYDSVAEEGLAWELLMLYRGRSFETPTICKMSVGLAGIGGSVVPATSNQLPRHKASERLKHTIHLPSTSASPIPPISQALHGSVNSLFPTYSDQGFPNQY